MKKCYISLIKILTLQISPIYYSYCQLYKFLDLNRSSKLWRIQLLSSKTTSLTFLLNIAIYIIYLKVSDCFIFEESTILVYDFISYIL